MRIGFLPGAAVLACVFACPVPLPSQATPCTVFVFIQRTDAHVKRSSAEVFHNTLNDLLSYLKGKEVAIAVDEFGGRNHAESATPLDTVFNIARDAKADYVLYIVVDRPFTKWIKVTVQSYAMDRTKLWQEEASNASALSGGQGFDSTMKRLHAQLDHRIGKEGLPTLPTVEPVISEP